MAAHTTLLGCMHLIVFTDLDGSLLEHGDYCFEAALSALDRIRASRVPLIFATSKLARK